MGKSDSVKELIKRLEGISTDDGFSIDPKEVCRDQESFSEDDELPVVNVVVGRAKVVQKSEQSHIYRMQGPVEVEVVALNRSKNPFDVIDSLIADIKKAVMIDNDLDGNCSSFSFEGESEAGRQYGGSLVSVSVGFLINYSEKHC